MLTTVTLVGALFRFMIHWVSYMSLKFKIERETIESIRPFCKSSDINIQDVCINHAIGSYMISIKYDCSQSTNSMRKVLYATYCKITIHTL